MKIFRYILSLVFSALLVGCGTVLLPGTVEGPIVDDSQPEKKIIDGKMAVNYMVTSLAMKCPPIANGGGDKPSIINNFTVSLDKVNDFQMEVWRRLIKMNMIIPVFDMTRKPKYKLTSEITKLPKGENEKREYLWIMSLTTFGDGKDIWNEQIEFLE